MLDLWLHYIRIEFLTTLETTFIETYTFFVRRHQREISCMEFMSFWLMDGFSFFQAPAKFESNLLNRKWSVPTVFSQNFASNGANWTRLMLFMVIALYSVAAMRYEQKFKKSQIRIFFFLEGNAWRVPNIIKNTVAQKLLISRIWIQVWIQLLQTNLE